MMEQISYHDELASTLFRTYDEKLEWYAFAEMCYERKLDPMSEIRNAIQARYDAMLAE